MILSRWLATIGLAGVLATGLRADDPPVGTKVADKLAALRKEQQDAEAAFGKATESLQENAEGLRKYDELLKPFNRGQSERFAAAVEIAKADPKSDTAVAALEWVLTIPRSHTLPAGIAAMEEVANRHAADARVGKLVASVGNAPPPAERHPQEAAAAWAMIEAVAKNNPDKTIRAQAALAQAFKAKAAYDFAARRNRPDAEQLASAAEEAYESLIREYGDCPRLIRENGGTVGEPARRDLYELRNLRVGKVAPEIEAEGVDGKPFKLSDYRGKVVAVIFWASWCAPCMAEVPYERDMTERLQGKPFTIVAVNGDLEREKAAEVMAKQRMTWPSFWNGTGGPDGPISRAWNVRFWPTVYVLDAQGVIRFKHARGKDLEEKVNGLIAELDTKHKSPVSSGSPDDQTVPDQSVPEDWKLLYRERFDAAASADWRLKHGTWKIIDGAWQGAEDPTAHHATVARHPFEYRDARFEVDFRFDGADRVVFSITGAKGGLCRVHITPGSLRVLKDAHFPDGSEQTEELSATKLALQTGVWHHARIELRGTEVKAQIGEVTGGGRREEFDVPKVGFALVVGGRTASFRDLCVYAPAKPD
jgi:thiol-disulfide isomerase/thioredoxin